MGDHCTNMKFNQVPRVTLSHKHMYLRHATAKFFMVEAPGRRRRIYFAPTTPRICSQTPQDCEYGVIHECTYWAVQIYQPLGHVGHMKKH